MRLGSAHVLRQHLDSEDLCYPPDGVCLQGGTAAAPKSLNDRNRSDPANVLPELSSCDFLVTWQEPDSPDTGWGACLLLVGFALCPVMHDQHFCIKVSEGSSDRGQQFQEIGTSNADVVIY